VQPVFRSYPYILKSWESSTSVTVLWAGQLRSRGSVVKTFWLALGPMACTDSWSLFLDPKDGDGTFLCNTSTVIQAAERKTTDLHPV